MNRRQFTTRLLAGVAGTAVARAVRATAVDDLAARVTAAAIDPNHYAMPIAPARVVEHWRVAQNNAWRWLERSELIGGEWRAAGMTLPVHRETGRPIDGRDCADYLLECQAPEGIGEAIAAGAADYCVVREDAAPGPSVEPLRKARDGRPPSHWARGLEPAELVAWLDAFEPPQADVSGMTFFEHLTRDHGFDSVKLAGLDDQYLAKLHGAAHGGY